MSNAAILLAAGRGTRMQGAVDDKVLAPIHGEPAITYSLNAFQDSGIISHIVIVFRDNEQREQLSAIIAKHLKPEIKVEWVEGGKERQDSVFHALQAIPLYIDYAFIHDGARPLIQKEHVIDLFKLVQKHGAAVLAHPVADTIKRTLPEPDSTLRMLQTVDRTNLWGMETPQVFELGLIVDAYRQLRFKNKQVTDDTAAVEALGKPVAFLQNDQPNIKLTRPADLALVEALLTAQS